MDQMTVTQVIDQLRLKYGARPTQNHNVTTAVGISLRCSNMFGIHPF